MDIFLVFHTFHIQIWRYNLIDNRYYKNLDHIRNYPIDYNTLHCRTVFVSNMCLNKRLTHNVIEEIEVIFAFLIFFIFTIKKNITSITYLYTTHTPASLFIERDIDSFTVCTVLDKSYLFSCK